METIGSVLLFGGFIIAAFTQIYIIFSAFRIRFSAGIFCLLITPIYAFTSDLRNEKNINLALKIWVSSIIIIIAGVIVFSSI